MVSMPRDHVSGLHTYGIELPDGQGAEHGGAERR
jgi:hypothetical protein